MRRIVPPLLAAALLLSVATAAPAQARPVGAESVRVIVRTDRMRAGVEQGVYIWAAGQTRYRLQLNDRCFAGDVCIVVDGTWWAGDWMSVDGVDVGSESWTDRRGRCQVRVPHVLSRMSQDVTAWVTAHEIGHCLGLSDTGGVTGVMGDSLGYAVSAAEAETIWESA